MTVLTLRIDDKMDAALNEWAQKSGRTKSDLARDAIRSQIFRQSLDEFRAYAVPKAQAMGIFTDEDVFRFLEENP
jgi:predicted transcriptional regulator